MNREKFIGLLRLKLNGILEPLKMCGQSVYVIQAINQIMAQVEILLDDYDKKV